VANLQVVAFCLAEAAVAVAVVELVDDAQLRIAGEAAAALGDAQLVAVAEDVIGMVGNDGVVDADLPPVQCDVKPFGERRAPDQAQRAAGRVSGCRSGLEPLVKGRGVCPLLPVMGSLPWPSWR
jgi:hypothetical protein